jgi:hypothetical protein
VGEAPGCLSERSHHVEVPHGKRPRDRDGPERQRQEMSLSSIELAPFTAFPTSVLGPMWCPQVPACISRSSSRP